MLRNISCCRSPGETANFRTKNWQKETIVLGIKQKKGKVIKSKQSMFLPPPILGQEHLHFFTIYIVYNEMLK